jgi:hypothetical protein
MFAAAARVLSVLMMTNPGDTMDEDAPVHSDDAMVAGDTAEGAGETAAAAAAAAPPLALSPAADAAPKAAADIRGFFPAAPQPKKAKDGSGGSSRSGGGGGGGGGGPADMSAAEKVAARAAAAAAAAGSKSLKQKKQAEYDDGRRWKPYMQYKGQGPNRPTGPNGVRRNWLQFSNDMKAARCICCIAAGSDSPFCSAEGVTRVNDDGLRGHEECKEHLLAERQYKVLEAEQRGVTLPDTVQSGFDKQAAQLEQGIINKMRSAYWLHKNDVPLAKMERVVELCEATGGDMGAGQYREDCAAYEFTAILADEITNTQLQLIRDSPAFSVLTDESTDVSGRQHLIMYMGYLGADGAPAVEFVTLRNVQRATAAALFEVV